MLPDHTQRALPWSPVDVHAAIGTRLGDRTPLNPDMVEKVLADSGRARNPSITTIVDISRYDCSRNAAHLPVRYVSALCAGNGYVLQETYLEAPRGDMFLGSDGPVNAPEP